MITAEPAVVIPTEFDDEYASVQDETDHDNLDPSHRVELPSITSEQVATRIQKQPGAMTRRASTYQPNQITQTMGPNTTQMGAMMRRASAIAIQRVTMDNSFRTDGVAAATPFSPRGMGSPRKRVVVRQDSLQQRQFPSPPLASTRKSNLKQVQLPNSPIL